MQSLFRFFLVAALLLAGNANAAEVTDTFGGTPNDNDGNRAYKLNSYRVTTDCTLVTIEQWIDSGNTDDTLIYALYEQDQNSANRWNLLWDSGEVVVPTGQGWKASQDVNVDLAAGRRYAMGVYLTTSTVGYFWDGGAGAETVSWGVREGAVWSQNGFVFSVQDPLFDNESSHSYHQRITVDIVVDNDGDGFDELVDCDDADPATYPGAPELCDGADNDCDGQVDNNVVFIDWYTDADGDGFGDPGVPPTPVCDGSVPPGAVSNANDCDDADAAVNPVAAEVCDGVDNNCDGAVDNVDNDGDGAIASDCGGADCDDGDPTVAPGAPELCNDRDDDCDGQLGPDEIDDDGDFVSECDGDCDDGDPSRSPAVPEDCANGIDDNCNGLVDEDVDQDNDGFGSCEDCNDTDFNTFPGALERCDGLDNDCDGAPAPDEQDPDEDGWIECAGDCGPQDPEINPLAAELCDGVDNDCDGRLLDGEDEDGDDDGFPACDDCDDANSRAYPGAREGSCDVEDLNCDGVLPDLGDCEPPVIEDVELGGCACTARPGDRPIGSASTALLLMLLAPLVRRRPPGRFDPGEPSAPRRR